MNAIKIKTAGIAFAAAPLLLAACGGGGDDASSSSADAATAAGSSNTTAVQGLYIGTASNGRTVTGLLLDNGSYYFLYSSDSGSASIGGVVQGTGGIDGQRFTSADMRDFNIDGLEVTGGTVDATVVAKTSLSGSIDHANQAPVSFEAAYDSDYDTPARLATLAGTYRGNVAFSGGAEAATVTIAADGSIGGQGVSGCKVTGTAAPHAQGNVYDLTLRFGGAPCLFADQTFQGIVYYRSAQRRLYAAAPNADRTDGVLFVATR